MNKRPRIAILFFFDDNWTGGLYYFYNFINALNLVDDKHKPLIEIISNSPEEYEKLKKSIDYPYLSFSNPYISAENIIKRFVNKISRIIIKKNIFNHNIKVEADVLYSILNPEIIQIKHPNKYCWIPDLQEHFLKDFFSPAEISKRIELQKKAIENNLNIVFSSQSALNDFNQIYPHSPNKKVVLNFAVFHPDTSSLQTKDVLDKFSLNNVFFIIPNQFWQHKNHIAVLEVAKMLKERNSKYLFVFTGKEYDARNPAYFDTLKKYVLENNIEDYIRFLGFIDRKEQLVLIKQAKAIIQPSLFEGWSTVVEDAKALNKFIILSNLSVHQEQINENVMFFEPTNIKDLFDKIISFNQQENNIANNYSNNQKLFAYRIIDTFNPT